MTDRRTITVYRKTATGQMFYDVCMSTLSATEVARRHKITREEVLEARRKYPEFRPGSRLRKASAAVTAKAKNKSKSRKVAR